MVEVIGNWRVGEPEIIISSLFSSKTFWRCYARQKNASRVDTISADGASPEEARANILLKIGNLEIPIEDSNLPKAAPDFDFITDRLAVGNVASRAVPGFIAVVSLLATHCDPEFC